MWRGERKGGIIGSPWGKSEERPLGSLAGLKAQPLHRTLLRANRVLLSGRSIPQADGLDP